MNLRAIATAVALCGGLALVAPGTAEARHRHDRSCRHDRHYDRDYRYDRYDRHDRRHSRYDRHYDRHRHRRHDDYRYRSRHDHYDRYYYAPPPHVSWHYHGRRRCSRSHVGFWFGW
jgi:hypothetical protein